MAAPTNTETTLTSKGLREDLSNIIYRVAAEDTPFVSNIGRAKAKAIRHEWQTEALRSPSGTNAALEGDDVGTLLGRLASRKCVAYDPAGNDGRETAIGILYESTPETGADQPAVAVTCDAEVAAGRLTGLDTAARADLAALGIKVRD